MTPSRRAMSWEMVLGLGRANIMGTRCNQQGRSSRAGQGKVPDALFIQQVQRVLERLLCQRGVCVMMHLQGVQGGMATPHLSGGDAATPLSLKLLPLGATVLPLVLALGSIALPLVLALAKSSSLFGCPSPLLSPLPGTHSAYCRERLSDWRTLQSLLGVSTEAEPARRTTTCVLIIRSRAHSSTWLASASA